MTFNVVIGAVSLLNLIWLIFNYFNSKHLEKINIKQNIYAKVIASAEEMREAYFEGEPTTGTKSKKGWVRTNHGWLREVDWKKSERYMETASQMNRALADLSLVANLDLCLACFHLEQIATDCRDFQERSDLMNLIVTLMREDLGTFTGNSKSIWGRRLFKFESTLRKIVGLQSRRQLIIDLPWH